MRDPASHLEQLFPGDSEMAGRMRAFDWSASAFGLTRDWPENLRVAIRLCLTSRFPICLWWARPLRFLYNDAFRPWLSDTKHSRALMHLGREVWSEDWHIIGPMLERVIATGEASWSEDTELYHNRKVPQVVFKPDWNRHARAAPFKRNDRILDVLPIGVIVFPGSGISANLADKAKKLGIPVWKYGGA